MLQEPQELVADLTVVTLVDFARHIHQAHAHPLPPHAHLTRGGVSIGEGQPVAARHRQGNPGERQGAGERGERRHQPAGAATSAQPSRRVGHELDRATIAGDNHLSPADEPGNLLLV
jgi:hypothetical protein